MHWKLKSRLQNAIAMLPSAPSYAAYYWLQRHFGGLRRIDPIERLRAAVETWRRLQALGHDPCGKVFLEVGTGRVPMTPLGYWLMGADSTITIDLNPYLRPELVRDSLRYIQQHPERIRALFGEWLVAARFELLQQMLARGEYACDVLLRLAGIVYIAPGDAARTGLDPGSIDFHTSYNVFEHIPPAVLRDILSEAARLLGEGGVCAHRIDYSDHFSHADRRLSSVHFLRYADDEWRRYADNRYMYMNRLRHDDLLGLFGASGHTILDAAPVVDPLALAELHEGRLQVDARFADKPLEVLATIDAWIVSRPIAPGR